MGGELIVKCQSEVLPFIAAIGAADRLVAKGEVLPEADLHCYYCSLPGLFMPEFASIPAAPYLTAPRDRRDRLRPLLANVPRALKLGIVCRAVSLSTRTGSAPSRCCASCRPSPFRVCSSTARKKRGRCTPICGPRRRADRSSIWRRVSRISPTRRRRFDLVIMTGSAVAHLTATLGTPVWRLLGHVGHWLWLLDPYESPWYPSLLLRPRRKAIGITSSIPQGRS